jgi:hypothetical protein
MEVNDYGNIWEFVELIESWPTDFTALKTLVAEAIRMTSETYPSAQAKFSSARQMGCICSQPAHKPLHLSKRRNRSSASTEEVDN